MAWSEVLAMHVGLLPKDWLRGVDLNHRPLGYEPNELPGCSTPQIHLTQPFPESQGPLTPREPVARGSLLRVAECSLFPGPISGFRVLA